MKLTRRSFVSKLPFGIAGVWAAVKYRRMPSGGEGAQVVKQPCGGRFYPDKVLGKAVEDFWQKETGQPYEPIRMGDIVPVGHWRPPYQESLMQDEPIIGMISDQGDVRWVSMDRGITWKTVELTVP